MLGRTGTGVGGASHASRPAGGRGGTRKGRKLQQGPENAGHTHHAPARCRFRRARRRLTLLCVRGKFSRLVPAVN
jgi:hypothetical protein